MLESTRLGGVSRGAILLLLAGVVALAAVGTVRWSAAAPLMTGVSSQSMMVVLLVVVAMNDGRARDILGLRPALRTSTLRLTSGLSPLAALLLPAAHAVLTTLVIACLLATRHRSAQTGARAPSTPGVLLAASTLLTTSALVVLYGAAGPLAMEAAPDLALVLVSAALADLLAWVALAAADTRPHELLRVTMSATTATTGPQLLANASQTGVVGALAELSLATGIIGFVPLLVMRWAYISAIYARMQVHQGATDRQLFDALVSGLPEAVALCDADGVILLSNDSLSRLVGDPADTLPGRHVLDCLPLRHGGEPLRMLDIAALHGGTMDVFGDVGDELVPLRLSAHDVGIGRYSGAGAPAGWTVVALSDRAQHLLEQRTTDTLLSTLVHELRTPLQPIRTYGELLASGPASGDIVREAGALIVGRVDYLDEMLRAVLATRSAEHVGFLTDTGAVGLVAELATVAADVKARFPDRTFTTNSADTGNLQVMTNRNAFAIILSNLLTNAAKYSDGDVTITVTAESGSTVVRVSDHGGGIPSASHERIFEEFFQVDPSSDGEGYGLFQIRLLARRLGGNVWLDDSNAAGSTFAASFLNRTGALGAAPYEGQS
jgi:signal transduction histidine kinase